MDKLFSLVDDSTLHVDISATVGKISGDFAPPPSYRKMRFERTMYIV